MSEDFKPAEATEGHRWLHQLVGEWTFEGECKTPEGVNKQSGRQTVKTFGDLWIISEMETDMEPAPMKSIITLGFDPEKAKFVGSFIATMMSSFWVYEGTLDAGGKILPLASKGPRFDGKGQADYVDVIEFVNKDEYLFRGRILDDGNWIEFMTSRYTRVR